jgi:hypothetical protein
MDASGERVEIHGRPFPLGNLCNRVGGYLFALRKREIALTYT